MAGRRSIRLVMLGTVAAFAGLALGNGLDRATAQRPGLAHWVPAPFKAEAWRAEAAAHLQAGDLTAATGAAAGAVQADPIDPRSAAVFGAVQLAGGQNIKADRTFRVAARFGWRDPLTQIYFMNAALAAGEQRLAALRLDAVLRQAPNLPLRDMLIAQFTSSPQGRAALAGRLAARPPWTDVFVRHVSQLPLSELLARAEVIRAVDRPAWGCDPVAPLVERLIQAGGIAPAKQLWGAHCPAAVDGVADPRFASAPQGRGPIPFEWNLPGSGDISAAPARLSKPGQTGLLARVSGASPQPVAWQLLSVAPGPYRLTWTAETAPRVAATGAELSLSCQPLGRSRILGTPLGGVPGRFEAMVTVDAACAGHYLTLWLTPGSAEVRFDELAITAR